MRAERLSMPSGACQIHARSKPTADRRGICFLIYGNVKGSGHHERKLVLINGQMIDTEWSNLIFGNAA